MLKSFSIIITLFLLASCGADKALVVEQTLESVENFLTNGQCTEAIAKINTIDNQPKNALYLKLKASAYACRAGYSTITFFANDLSKINATNLFSSLSTFSLSASFDGAGNSDYDDLQSAIDTLSYAGGLSNAANPNSAKRGAIFTSKENAEIDSFLLYLTLVQLGKYIHYYGSAGPTGIKGAAGASAPCFFPYPGSIAGLGAALAAEGGSCNNTGLGGHPDLVNGSDIDVPLACEGVILFNQFRDLLLSLTLGSIPGVDLTTIKTAIDTLISALTFNDSSIVSLTSQTKCEADFADAAGNTDLQTFFGFIFEILHNKT